MGQKLPLVLTGHVSEVTDASTAYTQIQHTRLVYPSAKLPSGFLDLVDDSLQSECDVSVSLYLQQL